MSCIKVSNVDCETTVLTNGANDVVEVDDASVIVTSPWEPVNILEVDAQIMVVCEEEPAEIIIACDQGPPGQDGADGIGIVEVSAGPISNSATVVVDTVARTAYRSVKWVVTIDDPTALLYKSYEILAVHNSLVALHTVYGKIGDPIDVSNEVAINGANFELQITNNSVNAILVKAQRIATTI